MVCDSSDGFYIVNHHRVHRRILADNATAPAERNAVESQELVIPFNLKLEPAPWPPSRSTANCWASSALRSRLSVAPRCWCAPCRIWWRGATTSRPLAKCWRNL
ncbi:hypothetical protein EON80_21375 [bacterium]|nr:MAG: hypothetical protein EON80_21375 [bacterium]